MSSRRSQRNHRFDALGPYEAAVIVEVLAPVRIQAPGLAAGTSPLAANRRDGVQQGQELGDVVPVPAGQHDGERGSVAVDDQVVLGAGAGAVDGRGANVIPPLRARTCDPSTEQPSRSNESARRSSASMAACRRDQTPASVQSRRRRQAVTPEQPTVSAGTSPHATPVRSTYRTPESATRSGTRSRPGCRRRRSGAGGSSGATCSHSSSGARSARTRTPCRSRSASARPAAQLILKRSVGRERFFWGARRPRMAAGTSPPARNLARASRGRRPPLGARSCSSRGYGCGRCRSRAGVVSAVSAPCPPAGEELAGCTGRWCPFYRPSLL